MINLRYCLHGSCVEKDFRHPQDVMENLGITYNIYAAPQSMLDCWWFLGCENVPDELPSFITKMNNFVPHKNIGNGLSKGMVAKLELYEKENKDEQ